MSLRRSHNTHHINQQHIFQRSQIIIFHRTQSLVRISLDKGLHDTTIQYTNRKQQERIWWKKTTRIKTNKKKKETQSQTRNYKHWNRSRNKIYQFIEINFFFTFFVFFFFSKFRFRSKLNHATNAQKTKLFFFSSLRSPH